VQGYLTTPKLPVTANDGDGSFCVAGLASSAERASIAARFRGACAEFGTEV
jgi:hypothetical protein